jgi:hypothetical protein
MTTRRRTYYSRRKTSASSKGKKSNSKRRNLRGGMAYGQPLRPNVISYSDGDAIKQLLGKYTNLGSFTNEDLIKHREALYAKREELKDCYAVHDLSHITSREYGYPDMKKYFEEQISIFEQEMKKRGIYTPEQRNRDYTKIEWLKPHRGIGIPKPVSVCNNRYVTKGWTK